MQSLAIPAILASLALSVVSAVSATFTVTNSSDASSPTTGSLRWAVQSANAAAGDDNVNFANGLSTINLTAGPIAITGGLTVSGSQSPDIYGTIQVQSTGVTLTDLKLFAVPGAQMLTVTSDGCTVFACTFNGGPSGTSATLSSSSNTVAGCTFNGQNEGPGRPGGTDLQLLGNSNMVQSNTFSGASSRAVLIGGATSTATGNMVYGNTISNKLREGVRLANAPGNFVGGNTINMANSQSGSGISIVGSSSTINIVFLNTVSNAFCGLFLGDGASYNYIGVFLQGNTFVANTIGIQVGNLSGTGSANSNVILSNDIEGGNGTGIVISNASTGNIVYVNHVNGCTGSGIWIYDSTYNVVTQNAMGYLYNTSYPAYGNGGYGLLVTGNSSRNTISGNYYGSNAAGPVYIDNSATQNYGP